MRTRERHQIYKKILADAIKCKVANGYNFALGFCHAFRDFLHPFNIERQIQENFPEIWKHKPKRARNDGYWFTMAEYGDNKRIEILKKAIEETKPKKKKSNKTK